MFLPLNKRTDFSKIVTKDEGLSISSTSKMKYFSVKAVWKCM